MAADGLVLSPSQLICPQMGGAHRSRAGVQGWHAQSCLDRCELRLIWRIRHIPPAPATEVPGRPHACGDDSCLQAWAVADAHLGAHAKLISEVKATVVQWKKDHYQRSIMRWKGDADAAAPCHHGPTFSVEGCGRPVHQGAGTVGAPQAQGSAKYDCYGG